MIPTKQDLQEHPWRYSKKIRVASAMAHSYSMKCRNLKELLNWFKHTNRFKSQIIRRVV